MNEAELKQKSRSEYAPGDVPFVVHDKGGGLVISHDLIDAKWIALFGKAGLKETYDIILRFDEKRKTVFTTQETKAIAWNAGLPVLTARASYFRGQKWEWKSEKAVGLGDDRTIGTIYDIDISYHGMLDGPLKTLVESAGWRLERDWNDPVTKGALVMGLIGGAGALIAVVALVALLLLDG